MRKRECASAVPVLLLSLVLVARVASASAVSVHSHLAAIDEIRLSVVATGLRDQTEDSSESELFDKLVADKVEYALRSHDIPLKKQGYPLLILSILPTPPLVGKRVVGFHASLRLIEELPRLDLREILDSSASDKTCGDKELVSVTTWEDHRAFIGKARAGERSLLKMIDSMIAGFSRSVALARSHALKKDALRSTQVDKDQESEEIGHGQ